MYRARNKAEISWTGHVAKTEDSSSTFKILIRKPTRKRTLRSRLRWENDTRIDFKETVINKKITSEFSSI